jgi:hypothetical protein
MTRKRYTTDLTDAEWELLEAVQKVVAFSVTLPSKKKEGIG